MKKLVILDDDLDFAKNLFNQISIKLNNIKIEYILSNSLEFINNNIPNTTDILLLDLEMPNINGIELLNIIKENNCIPPYIIIISGNGDLILKLKEYTEYIYKVFQKPVSIDTLIKTLSDIEVISRKLDIQHIIYDELSKFNFNKKRIGYQYIIEAIKIVLENGDALKDLKNNIYPIISKRHKESNTLKIKWAIEQCINNLYKTTNINILNSYFGITDSDNLTPKQFISIIVENIKINFN